MKSRCRSVVLFTFGIFIVITNVFLKVPYLFQDVKPVFNLRRDAYSLHLMQDNGTKSLFPLDYQSYKNSTKFGEAPIMHLMTTKENVDESDALLITSTYMTGKSKEETHKPFLCDEECNWLKLQKSRRKSVLYACGDGDTTNASSRSNQPSKITKDVLNHVLVCDKFRLLYCYIPKVACTNWKRILLLLDGKNVTNVHAYPIRKLNQYSRQEAEKRLRTYTKFMFVRNPHERLLSAYKEKFTKFSTYSIAFQKNFGPKIFRNNIRNLMRKYGIREETHKLNAKETLPVTFQEFMRYVSDITNRLADPAEEHWREMHRLCSPCSIHYDFIGKMETLVEDTHYILKRAGAEHLDEIMKGKPHATNSSNERIVQEAFAQVTEEDISQFEKRFEKDMKLFGYQRPTSITKFKSGEEDRKDADEKLGRYFNGYPRLHG